MCMFTCCALLAEQGVPSQQSDTSRGMKRRRGASVLIEQEGVTERQKAQLESKKDEREKRVKEK